MFFFLFWQKAKFCKIWQNFAKFHDTIIRIFFGKCWFPKYFCERVHGNVRFPKYFLAVLTWPFYPIRPTCPDRLLDCPAPNILLRLSCMAVLPRLLSRPICPVLVVLFSLSCLGSTIPTVLSGTPVRVSCPCCPVPAVLHAPNVLSQLSCPSSNVTAVPSLLACPSGLVLSVLSRLTCQVDLRLTSLGCSVPVATSQVLRTDCTVMIVFPRLSRTGCPDPTVLSFCCHVLADLSSLFCPGSAFPTVLYGCPGPTFLFQLPYHSCLS